MENNLFKSGVLLFALGSMSCISLWAQGTVEDYNRAYALREKYNAKHVLYAGVVPHWVDQTSAFWYVRQTEKGKEYVKVDAASKKRTALFDQQKMAAALTEKAGREINAYNASELPVKYFIGYVTLPIGREVLGLQHQK